MDKNNRDKVSDVAFAKKMLLTCYKVWSLDWECKYFKTSFPARFKWNCIFSTIL